MHMISGLAATAEARRRDQGSLLYFTAHNFTLRLQKHGAAIKAEASQLPSIHVEVFAQPITRTVLRVTLKVMARPTTFYRTVLIKRNGATYILLSVPLLLLLQLIFLLLLLLIPILLLLLPIQVAANFEWRDRLHGADI